MLHLRGEGEGRGEEQRGGEKEGGWEEDFQRRGEEDVTGGLFVALEIFAGFSRLLFGGGEVVKGWALGMLSMFTGVGGALPERGRESP